MQNKDIVIIALLVLVIYLYWQNNQKSLTAQSIASKKDTEISELRNQTQHYQKLYQVRVEKDLETQNLLNGQTIPELQQANKDWESRFNELEELNNQQASEAKQTVKELKEHNQLYLQKITDLETSLFNLAKQKIKGKKEAEQLVNQLEANYHSSLQTQESNWQSKEKELNNQLTQLQKANDKFNQSLTNQQATHQQKQEQFNEQLRKINLLFDPQAKHYQTIDFNGLYSLLSQIKPEQEILQEQLRQINLKLTNTETNLKETENKLTKNQELQLEKEEKIKQLNQENLTNAQTITEQSEKIKQKDQDLTMTWGKMKDMERNLVRIKIQTEECKKKASKLERENEELKKKIVKLEKQVQDYEKIQKQKIIDNLEESSEKEKIMTLQQYLNSKYPTKEEREQVKVLGNWPDTVVSGKKLDLSEYVNLEKFWFIPNEKLIAEIILGNKPKLTDFTCSKNEIRKLDLSNCPNLKVLTCCKSWLESLDVSHNPKLTDLWWDKRYYNLIIGLEKTSILRLDCRSDCLLESKNAKFLWKFLWRFFTSKYECVFPEMKLINIDDLNELASQVNEETVNDYEFLTKICPNSKIKSIFSTYKGSFYFVLDQLANTILARCLIVQNRLYKGPDKEYENDLEDLAKKLLKCDSMNPKNPAASLYENREKLVNLALSGDKEILARLADLPYISKWVRENC